MTTVFIDENSIQNLSIRLDSVRKDVSNQIYGFVVGHRSADADYLVHLIRWSDKLLLDHIEDLKDEKLFPNSTTGKDSNIEEESVIFHAKQLVRMLPGGTQILGLFVIGSKKHIIECQAFLIKIFRQIDRVRADSLSLLREQTPNSVICQNRCLLLSRDISTKKLTAIFIDVNSNSSRPSTTASIQERKLQYATINCTLCIDCGASLKQGGSDASSFEAHCAAALRPFFRRFGTMPSATSCVVVFDGAFRDDRESLTSALPSEKKWRHGGGKKSPGCAGDEPIFDVRLMAMEGNDDDVISEATQRRRCTARMHFKGAVVCKVRLPIKFTFGEARDAILEDLARSLCARVHLHAEGVGVLEEGAASDGEMEPETYHRLPRRIFFDCSAGKNNFPNLLACDYLFEAETKRDAAKNFVDVLDLAVDANDAASSVDVERLIADDVERVPDADDLLSGVLEFSCSGSGSGSIGPFARSSGSLSSASLDSLNAELERQRQTDNIRRLNRWTLVYVAVGAAVGLLACLLYFLLQG